MKNRILTTLLLASVFSFAPLTACRKSRTNSTPIKRLTAPLSPAPTESDFDFPPLPKESTSEGIWDVTDVDISDINPNKKLISFTFDDAPASTLENILSVFAEFNESNPDCPATATLFCNGNLIDNNALPTLSASLALGWELGNHTHSHPDITTLDDETFLSELSKTEARLSEVDGKEKHLFRAPFGRINERIKSLVNVPLIDWTIDTLDWTNASENEIYDTVFSQKFSGAIVLMHDGYFGTVDALKRLLPDLKEAGYQVVSVSKMSKAHECPLKNGSAYIRARKKGGA